MRNSKEVLELHGQRRRAFIKSFAKLSIAAPAVALLLSRSAIVQADKHEKQPDPSSTSKP